MSSKKIFILKVVSAAALVLINRPAVAGAVGIQISPAKIDLSISADQDATAELTVANPTSEVQLFRVYAEEFSENIFAYPSSFTLEAGGRKEVQIKINFSRLIASSSIVVTNIAVTGKPLSGESFLTTAGLKIPLTIRFTSESNRQKNLFTSYFLGAIVLISLLFLAANFF